jgi:uncharacterized protein (DUF1684 family)
VDHVSTALAVADWRRRVFALYASVRQLSVADPAAAHEHWRLGRDELFATHPASPLLRDDRADFSGLPVSAYDPTWRCVLPIEPVATQTDLALDTGTDGVVRLERIGRVNIDHVGALDVWRLVGYAGGLFIPVKDGLAGRSAGTYPGGRYLLDTIKGAHLGMGDAPNSLVIDFNFAYNPSCAYDPAWACPLAPPGNVVAVDIPVGERYESRL